MTVPTCSLCGFVGGNSRGCGGGHPTQDPPVPTQIDHARRYREDNPERVTAARLRYLASHRDEEKARRLREYYRKRNENPVHLWATFSLKNARMRARQRGLPFDLSIEDLLAKATARCPISLCGHRTLVYCRASSDGRHAAASADRIDPRTGYVASNLWVVCFECNRRMAENTAEDLEVLAAAKRWARAR